MNPRNRYNENQATAAVAVSDAGGFNKKTPDSRNAAAEAASETVAKQVAADFVSAAESVGMHVRDERQRAGLVLRFAVPAGQHRDLVTRLTKEMRIYGALPSRNRQDWYTALQRLQDQVDAAVAGEDEMPADDRPRWHIHETNTDHRVTFSMDEAVEAQRAGHAVIGVGVNHELQYIVQPGDEVGTWHRQLISGELIPVDVRPLSEWRKHHGHDEWGSLDVVA